MDLENLKSEWSAMNDRMEKQEILKEKMYRQILNTKSDQSLNRLATYEIVGLIFGILFIPALVYMYNKFNDPEYINKVPKAFAEQMGFVRTVTIGAIVFLAPAIIWIGFKLFFILLKINFVKPMKDNLFYVNKYAIYIKYEKLIGYYFIFPLAVLICIFHYAKIHASLFWWVLMSCSLIVTIFFVIFFYRLYDKNISTIQQNLDELQELKEE